MNSLVILLVATFLAAATLVLSANVPNPHAPPVLLTAAAPPNPGDLNQSSGQNTGPLAAAPPATGDADDLEKANTFGFGFWGGGYPYYRGGYWGYPRRYWGYPYYGYGGGYYGGYYGW